MSRIVDDVKTGLKGIRGAGDAIRGEAMEVTDQAFDNDQTHPETQTAQAKNRAIAEKGRQDVKKVDDMFAQREWERKGVPRTDAHTTAHHSNTSGGADTLAHSTNTS
ncbi:uncharacterized protein F4812DRAFT_407639 [Daldinia caldariorum]|uniref:uncharacterized protein n=1 Tax=Daldinia caldariorum TaxID=326644 RepID=UPI0020087F10|nr:uncharacterized protein F4812DRAFT_407639 [Daldinia caldariorum]KAI1472146.1 hypothetical protein F4812DRAFT_407639 [Daldinia caldariorum]